jgi:nitrate reductase gamma subunit
MNMFYARARTSVVAVVILMALRIQMAMAHAGHSHTDEGLNLTTTLGVAGVVAVLGIAVLLTNRVYRAREIPGKEDDPGVT